MTPRRISFDSMSLESRSQQFLTDLMFSLRAVYDPLDFAPLDISLSQAKMVAVWIRELPAPRPAD